jgi:hypothetical protein
MTSMRRSRTGAAQDKSRPIRVQSASRDLSSNSQSLEKPGLAGFSMVEVRGFEPLASSVRGKRSAGLSYTPNLGCQW